MEVDILSWEVRDAIMRSRQKAIRLRRAKLQRSRVLTALALITETRVKMTKWLKELLMNLWWNEQVTRTEFTMIQGGDLTITAKWGINQDNVELFERGEVSGRGKFLEWELSLRVTSLQEQAEMIKDKIVGEITEMIIEKAWDNIDHKESRVEDLKTTFGRLKLDSPHGDDDFEMEPASNGILPTSPPPPTSQRPPGHPVGESGGRLHPPQSPNLQGIWSWAYSMQGLC